MTLIPIAAALHQAFPRHPQYASAFDMLRAFAPIDRLLDDISAGEVLFAGADPVMYGYDGEYDEVVPSLLTWTRTLERMADRINVPLDLGLIRRIGKRLEVGMVIDDTDLVSSRQLLDKARSVYIATPTRHRKAATTEEMIDIELEVLGLKEAAA